MPNATTADGYKPVQVDHLVVCEHVLVLCDVQKQRVNHRPQNLSARHGGGRTDQCQPGTPDV